TLLDPEPESCLPELADLLARTLPGGSAVAVGWDDPLLGATVSLSAEAEPVHWAAVEAVMAGDRVNPDLHAISDAWQNGTTRVALVAQPAGPLPAALRESWLMLARSTVDAHFGSARA